MTTINDRVERLENAFITVAENQDKMIGILQQHATMMHGIIATQQEQGAIQQEQGGVQQEQGATLQALAANQDKMIDILQQHTTMMHGIIATQQEQGAIQREQGAVQQEQGDMLLEHRAILQILASNQERIIALHEAVVSILNEHSVDLKFIREYLG